MTTPDPILTARLAELDNALRLAQSQVGGTGWAKECDALRAALLAAYYAGQLITAAEADARVEAAVQKALREHAGREETGESITEKYLRRYPQSKKTKAWEGAMVYLRTQNGIWRPDGHGYTVNFSEAWAMPLSDARKIVSGIYEDHGGTYFRALAAAIRSRGVTG